MRAAIYARVSTLDQEPENQLVELRRYVEARGWTWAEFVDRGVSGSRDRRPALDAVLNLRGDRCLPRLLDPDGTWSVSLRKPSGGFSE